MEPRFTPRCGWFPRSLVGFGRNLLGSPPSEGVPARISCDGMYMIYETGKAVKTPNGNHYSFLPPPLVPACFALPFLVALSLDSAKLLPQDAHDQRVPVAATEVPVLA